MADPTTQFDPANSARGRGREYSLLGENVVRFDHDGDVLFAV